MKLIVGLGNPGPKYERTRHNAGFRAVRAFHTLHIEELDGWKGKFSAELSEGRVSEEKIALLLPQTFMNLSGDAVIQAVQFWHIEPKDVVLVYDELDIPLGNVRIRPGGSAGGHNGVKSVLERLGTQDVPRIRIGIGTERAATVPAEDYVLERFNEEEEQAIAGAIDTAAKAIETFIAEGIEKAATTYGK
ncbi:MAG TPA: aminoacyl-tRNA hydrolase [Candidatus Binatia bacterium]|nr:aminoacyl-tRNA hydrolase [Candidatus Binatia bacterium]